VAKTVEMLESELAVIERRCTLVENALAGMAGKLSELSLKVEAVATLKQQIEEALPHVKTLMEGAKGGDKGGLLAKLFKGK
jgi:hypothetical protein